TVSLNKLAAWSTTATGVLNTSLSAIQSDSPRPALSPQSVVVETATITPWQKLRVIHDSHAKKHERCDRRAKAGYKSSHLAYARRASPSSSLLPAPLCGYLE